MAKELMKVVSMHNRRSVARAVLHGVLMLLLAGLACNGRTDESEPAARDGGRWTRVESAGRYSFLGEVLEDEDLSGLAFLSDRFGLIGADEARAVQVVELAREAKTLRVVQTFPLLRSGDEIDIEAIAAEGQYYYVVGSHGVSKKQGEQQGNRYRIFRLKANPVTGLPADVEVATLADILRADEVLGKYFQVPLQRKGVNVEGLAARDGRLFVGFRNPNLDGDAFVMEIAAEDVFGRRPRPVYRLHRLPLGPGLGIREIVAGQSGFLIIAGNAGSEPSETFADSQDYEEDRDFILFHWDGKGADVHRIGPLPDIRGKAEAMAILEESDEQVTVLVLFDGPKRGRPTVYRIF